MEAHRPTGQTRASTALHTALDQAAAGVAEHVVAWRHQLHAHSELSNREVQTARLVAEHLRSLGLDAVRTGIAGYGVVGVLRGGQPGPRVMALRADMDALPVQEQSGVDFASTVVDTDYPGGPFPVAHACGHDCHTAMLMGAAVLAGVRHQLPGTVLFVFQPAEERPPLDEDGGAVAMEQAGAFADPVPTMVFGLHVGPYPKGVVAYRVGNQYAASVLVKIEITGQQVHGSTPWLGLDPLPVAADIITTVGQLYRQIPAYDPVTISIGHVEDRGRFNIIGESVTLYGTVRCSVEADMEAVCQRLRRMADHLAHAHGYTADVQFLQHVPALHNTAAWVHATLPTLKRVVGHDRLVQTHPPLGYDDVSVFINRYGGLYVVLGVQDAEFRDDGTLVPSPGGRGIWFNHNPRFYADDGVLATGVHLHAHVTVDHLRGDLAGA
jgi:amidohydrolase